MTTSKISRDQNTIQKPKQTIVLFALLSFALLTILSFGYEKISDFTGQPSSSLTFSIGDTPQQLEIMARKWNGENSVIFVNAISGEVNQRFPAGYNTTVKITENNDILYIYNRGNLEDVIDNGVISAIDVTTGSELWKSNIPGQPFSVPEKEAAWLSSDENKLYLMGSPDNLKPYIYIVNTKSGELIQSLELPLPYPTNVEQAFPQAWKIPDTETLLVTSRDQIFTFDLAAGRVTNTLYLLDSVDTSRIPPNLPHNAFIWSGDMAIEMQQAFITTSTQEIFAIDFGNSSLNASPVLSLPEDWQFATAKPLLYQPMDNLIYIQVKGINSPITNGLEAEEIWVYDVENWKIKAKLSLSKELDKVSESDLTNYGLSLSSDKQTVYSLSKSGILQISMNSVEELQATWLTINKEDLALYSRMAILR